MRDNARALLQLLFEYRPDLVVRIREEIDRYKVRGRIILLEDAAMIMRALFCRASFWIFSLLCL